MENKRFDSPEFVEEVGKIHVWFCTKKTVRELQNMKKSGIGELEKFFEHLDNAVKDGYAERVEDTEDMEVASETYRAMGWVMVSFMDEKAKPIVEASMRNKGLSINYESYDS